jgi:hypothetical protein
VAARQVDKGRRGRWSRKCTPCECMLLVARTQSTVPKRHGSANGGGDARACRAQTSVTGNSGEKKNASPGISPIRSRKTVFRSIKKCRGPLFFDYFARLASKLGPAATCASCLLFIKHPCHALVHHGRMFECDGARTRRGRTCCNRDGDKRKAVRLQSTPTPCSHAGSNACTSTTTRTG